MNAGSASQIACPYCGSQDTELFSLFGRQLLTVQYYCNACRTPFERVKGDDVLEDAARHARSDPDNHLMSVDTGNRESIP